MRYGSCPEDIALNLNTLNIVNRVYFYRTVCSTNDIAKELALKEDGEGMLVIAETQSSGRGRLGRQWASDEKGIWMSLVLKPEAEPCKVQTLTLAASVAVCAAVERLTGMAPGIKWPNDIVVNGRKLCGILTEMKAEGERTVFVVVGIGINYSQKENNFPAAIRERAISLVCALDEGGYGFRYPSKADVIRATMEELEPLYQMAVCNRAREMVEEWKRYSVTLGKSIRVINGSREYTGMAEDINDAGQLVVRTDDGSIRLVSAGEVSIRESLDTRQEVKGEEIYG